MLPEKELFGLATSQLISDMEVICRELDFSVVFSNSLFKAFSKVLFGKYRLYIVPYPGVLNPVSHSFVLGFLKMIIGYGLRFLSFFGKKIVFYVYDLPIEQNIFVYGKCPKEKLSRIVEKMFLSSASFILVFNKLNLKYLNSRYGLDKIKFEYFELLDYGLKISTFQGEKEYSKEKIIVVYSANFINPSIQKAVKNFLRDCGEATGMEFIFVGEGSNFLGSENKGNFQLINEIPPSALSSLYAKCHFGLVLKCSSYYEFGTTSKFSSYLHSGMPVLVPENYAYLAGLVRKYSCGFVFRNCSDLVKKLSSLSKAEYLMLSKNAQLLGYKIRNGYFFKRALLKILKKMF
uniref:Glucosyltransferase 3-like C-terminal domain-containing protein n=1 Tax=Thermofilum adornatum TaxID=1365176 RepID=A0A7C1CD89_9CREN